MPRKSTKSTNNYGVWRGNPPADLSQKELLFSVGSTLSRILEAVKKEFPGVQLSGIEIRGNRMAGSGGAGMTDGGFMVGAVVK
jgi:hypothetical protein